MNREGDVLQSDAELAQEAVLDRWAYADAIGFHPRHQWPGQAGGMGGRRHFDHGT